MHSWTGKGVQEEEELQWDLSLLPSFYKERMRCVIMLGEGECNVHLPDVVDGFVLVARVAGRTDPPTIDKYPRAAAAQNRVRALCMYIFQEYIHAYIKIFETPASRSGQKRGKERERENSGAAEAGLSRALSGEIPTIHHKFADAGRVQHIEGGSNTLRAARA